MWKLSSAKYNITFVSTTSIINTICDRNFNEFLLCNVFVGNLDQNNFISC